MRLFRLVTTGLVLTLAFGSTAQASQTGGASTASAASPQATAAPPQTQTPPAKTEEQKPPTKKEEVVVVSASKTEQQLVDAPATMTVIGERALTVAPSNNYADVLRTVPGTNITQISARDVNVNTRGATSSLATSQLTVVDGRSVYLDFFGFTMWEFVPADLHEIKRIEVIRGPASAIWGANALNGVVSFITKTPARDGRHSRRARFRSVSARSTSRSIDNGAENGTMFYTRGVARAGRQRAMVLQVQRRLLRLGCPGAADRHDSERRDTRSIRTTQRGQPAAALRRARGLRLCRRHQQAGMAGGIGGTDGMMHTGIGPFRIAQGAQMSYWKATYTRKALRIQTFMNMLDGEATNVVSVTPTGMPLGLTFAPKTFDVELGDTQLLGDFLGDHAITYGGNFRVNRFDLSIAPGENSRNEGGAYIQDEWVMGAALPARRRRARGQVQLDRPRRVFTPRGVRDTSRRWISPFASATTARSASPSMVNNNLDTAIGTPMPARR